MRLLINTVYALDASTIDLSLSLFPWAPFRRRKAAVKLHTLLDRRGNIPTFIHSSDGKLHDVNVLDHVIPEPGAFYLMDRGYLDFSPLFALHSSAAFFVIRPGSNTQLRRLDGAEVDKSTGLRCDQTVVLTGVHTPDYNPELEARLDAALQPVGFSRSDIDAAIRYTANPHFPGLVSHCLAREDLVPVCSPTLVEGKDPLREPADLVRFRLLHTRSMVGRWRD